MARKSGSTILQEELYPPADECVRREADDPLDDGRLLELDVEQESPFLRGQKRVSARRSSLPKKTATHLTWGLLGAVVLFVCAAAVAALYHYGEYSWRFRIESSDDLEIEGLHNVTRAQVMEVMGGDIGRNIFFVPLSQRRLQLQQIPWVESASVMRFVPNRLKIEIRERTPVAFARIDSKIVLIDAEGTLMDLPLSGKRKYSFPVILGMNVNEPRSTRGARMKIYNDLVGQLDAGGARYSQDLSEVDISDPEDVKVLANDPGGEVLVHLGSSNYLERYQVYVSHVRGWREQFEKLDSVDLRYERQIVVNPDLPRTVKPPPLSVPAARAAMAAGATQVSHASIRPRTTTAGVPRQTVRSPAGVEAKRTAVRAHLRKHGPGLRKASLQAKLSPSTGATHAVPSPPHATAPLAKDLATGTTATNPSSKPSPAISKAQEP